MTHHLSSRGKKAESTAQAAEHLPSKLKALKKVLFYHFHSLFSALSKLNLISV
jgi:hypothetical protein